MALVKKILRSSRSATGVTRVSNVATVTLSSAFPNNNLKVGQEIVISGATPSSFNGKVTIATVASQTSFTYANAGSDESTTVQPVAGGDHSTMSNWDTNEATDLVSDGDSHWLDWYNDWPSGLNDIADVGIGWTTDATHDVTINVPLSERHNGIPQTGAWMWASASVEVLEFQVHGKLIGLDVENTTAFSTRTGLHIRAAAVDIVADSCISKNANGNAIVVQEQSGGTALLINSLGYDSATGIFSTSPVQVSHCVAKGSTVGFDANGGTGDTIVSNCVAYNNTTNYFDVGYDATSTNNAASDGSTTTPPGLNPITTDIVSGDFADAANDDFHLADENSTLWHAGVPISGVVTDIDGNHYHAATPSVGFHEVILPVEGDGDKLGFMTKTLLSTLTKRLVSFLNYADGVAAYIVNAVTFDGTNDYLLRGGGLTGAADGKKGIINVWFQAASGLTSTFDILNAFLSPTARVQLQVVYSAGDHYVTVRLRDSIGTLNQIQAAPITADTNWHNILCSWDNALDLKHLYIDDVDFTPAVTLTDFLVDYTPTEWAIGADTIGNNKLDGCLSELYFNQAEYIDFSVVANRRKFIKASGKPENVGSDGSTPTGTAPIIYQNGDSTDFQTNQGSGGDFSVTGALTDCGSSPSD
jgi:hypothetical protein